ncbi:Probable RNA-directed DNA polymerase from transposon BS [Eumeta japonica]|uniref:Probable RNA-directed DNA polymerase from transposon BS n=1 Tax=Eumeta variegata TaxID=151549 RepID=A0A4C1SLX6_EUMVA|nr:Probable RNA-directed DNA polymerase from transposon BS [Eumeta japonica]
MGLERDPPTRSEGSPSNRRVRGHACPQKPDNDLAFDDQEKLSISPTVSNSNAQPAPRSRTRKPSKTKSSVGPRYLPKTIYRRSRQTRSKTHQRVKTQKGTGPGWANIRKVLKSRLSDHLLEKGLIINEQFGSGQTTPAPNKPSDLSNTSRRALNANETVAVFFDVAKAFDKVWHAGLIQTPPATSPRSSRLHHPTVPDEQTHFSFRHEKAFLPKTDHSRSPQGSTLSPLLYSAATFRARKRASNSRSSPTTPPYT